MYVSYFLTVMPAGWNKSCHDYHGQYIAVLVSIWSEDSISPCEEVLSFVIITDVFFLRSPVLAMAIAVVLFCFYLYVKRKRTSNNVSIPTTQDGNTSLEFHTASPPGGQAEEHQRRDRFPPRYSTVDHPPPYSLVREPCYSGNDITVWKKGGKMSTCLSESTFCDGFSNYR